MFKNILVAEDDILSREIYQEMFEPSIINKEYNITYIKNGVECIKLLDENPNKFDLLILNMSINIEIGCKVCQFISNTSKLKIFIVSTSILQCNDCCFGNTICKKNLKPFIHEEIIVEIKKCLI